MSKESMSLSELLTKYREGTLEAPQQILDALECLEFLTVIDTDELDKATARMKARTAEIRAETAKRRKEHKIK